MINLQELTPKSIFIMQNWYSQLLFESDNFVTALPTSQQIIKPRFEIVQIIGATL